LSSREPSSFSRRTLLHVVSEFVVRFGIAVVVWEYQSVTGALPEFFKYDEGISLYVQLVACTSPRDSFNFDVVGGTIFNGL
jgi:hypothetical protein